MKKLICILFIVLMLSLTVLSLVAGAAGVTSSPIQSDGEVAADGINTNVVTVWIIVVSVIVSASIVAATVVLAKRNRNTK